MSERCLKWLLLAPTLIVVAAMAAFPLGYSLVLSFRQWKLAQSNTPGDFIGLQNYTNLLSDDPEFWDSVRVTLVFVGADVLVTLAIALSVALLLRKKGRVNSLARVLLMLPFV
ncbi:MAG: carbohydrate ABC transporter permease, partial [Polaromonas sp.]